EFDHDVAFAQASALTRAARFDAQNENSTLDRQIKESRHTPVHLHILSGDSDVTAPNSAISHEPACDIFRSVDADGAADALRREDDSGVHADDFSARVEQRPARVAGIQG